MTTAVDDKSAGQPLVCSDDRSRRQRIASTLRTMGFFLMTHHVGRAALPGDSRLRARRTESVSLRAQMSHTAVFARVFAERAAALEPRQPVRAGRGT